MDRKKVRKRDLYLLLMGFLLAFLILVVYQLLDEVMNYNTYFYLNPYWVVAQAVIVVLISLVLIWMIFTKLEEDGTNRDSTK